MEDHIHHSLECGQGVAKTKKHDKAFVKATFGKKGSFPFITFCNLDVIVSLFDIKLRKDLGTRFCNGSDYVIN